MRRRLRPPLAQVLTCRVVVIVRQIEAGRGQQQGGGSIKTDESALHIFLLIGFSRHRFPLAVCEAPAARFVLDFTSVLSLFLKRTFGHFNVNMLNVMIST